jgi:hypothetical protein|nr:MAG TPA: hypothetical protein [Caudoviricetes sp.]
MIILAIVIIAAIASVIMIRQQKKGLYNTPLQRHAHNMMVNQLMQMYTKKQLAEQLAIMHAKQAKKNEANEQKEKPIEQ